jgi:hypothetical protein
LIKCSQTNLSSLKTLVSKVRERTLPSEGPLAAKLFKIKLSEDLIVVRAICQDALNDVGVFGNTDAIFVV